MSYSDIARHTFASLDEAPTLSSSKTKGKGKARRRANRRNRKNKEARADVDHARVGQQEYALTGDGPQRKEADLLVMKQSRADHEASRDDSASADADNGVKRDVAEADVDLARPGEGTQGLDEGHSRTVRKRKADEEAYGDAAISGDRDHKAKRVKTEGSAGKDDVVAAEEETDQNDYRDIFRRMIKLLKGDTSEEEAIKKQKEEAARARAEAEAAETAVVAICQADAILDAVTQAAGDMVAFEDVRRQIGGEKSASVEDGDMWEWCMVEDMSVDDERGAEVAEEAVDGVQEQSLGSVLVEGEELEEHEEREESSLAIRPDTPRTDGARTGAAMDPINDSVRYEAPAQVSAALFICETKLTMNTRSASAARLRWTQAQGRRVRCGPGKRGDRILLEPVRRGSLL
ncbi:hypothetical protein OH77DRAFT_1429753 [Trametes cingulata]|nr:hypothetical protein OH77DRAFT_1429753 [Trametes cingulata]